MVIRIGDKYQIGPKLGQGSFGEVYEGFDLENLSMVAIKMAEDDKLIENLKREEMLYGILGGGVSGIPNLKWCGMENGFFFLVMDKLGPSLSDLLVKSERGNLSLKMVCNIAIQGLSILEEVHSRGIIHRDMKPSNFLMGTGTRSNKLFLVDFGLAKPFRDLRSGEHIRCVGDKKLTGTVRYVSISTHLGFEQSRKDDLESFGYVLIHLARGRLPWWGIKDSDKLIRNQKIKNLKIETSLTTLCQGLPKHFVEYMEYCRKLKFAEKPNYDFLRRGFIALISGSSSFLRESASNHLGYKE